MLDEIESSFSLIASIYIWVFLYKSLLGFSIMLRGKNRRNKNVRWWWSLCHNTPSTTYYYTSFFLSQSKLCSTFLLHSSFRKLRNFLNAKCIFYRTTTATPSNSVYIHLFYFHHLFSSSLLHVSFMDKHKRNPPRKGILL